MIEEPVQAVVESPLGPLLLGIVDKELVSVDFITAEERGGLSGLSELKRFAQAFNGYFNNPKHHFSVAVQLQGTPFQRRVWGALQEIPSGSVLTYGELALRLQTSARAVGNACRGNPCPIIVPCHRVVSANGLGGYGGQVSGPVLERKRWLLRHEGVIDG